MKYKYISLNEGFYNWLETNYLPINSQILFLNMIHQFNLSGWQEWIRISNQRIMSWIQTNREATAISARDKLLEKNLIVYIKGKKNEPNKYKLNEKLAFIFEAQNVVNGEVKSEVYPEAKSEVQSVDRYRQDKTRQDKEILSKESTKKVRGMLTFKAPSLSDVQNYCFERGNSVSAEAFINFYESNGWYVGKNKMKDWKAAVRTWEMRDSNYQNQKKGERNYGSDESEVGRRAQCTEFLDVESTDGSKLSPEEIARIRAENEEFAKLGV